MLIPEQCIFTFDKGFAIDACRKALVDNGIVLIKAMDGDDEGRTMQLIVSKLGMVGVYDQRGTSIWDVRYDDSVDQEKGTRSLTAKEFPVHTDGSFETPPPKFVALFCVEEDRLGGGETLFVDSGDILPLLSETTKETLKTEKFKLRIPHEFFKGQDYKETPLLDESGRLRFRRDIIQVDDTAPHMVQAVEELDNLINSEKHAKPLMIRKGEIVVFDNSRYLHGRRKVEDNRRHLKRMWFHLRED